MSLESPQSSAVPDSEIGDDVQQIFYNPLVEIFRQASSLGSEMLNDHQNKGEVISSSQDDAASTGIIIDTAGPKRSLRKRKAIQKLPYSLERIKHQQLLKGYDITSFEDTCEHVNLPKKPSPQCMQDGQKIISARQMNEEDPDSFQNDFLIDNYSDSPEVLSMDSNGIAEQRTMEKLSRVGEAHDKSSFSIDFESDKELEVDVASQDQMMFRGRLINMRTGYRGILPRVAWEKSLNNKPKRKIQRKKQLLMNQKGLARRRLISKRNNQDDILMNDLIAPNDEIEDQEENIYRMPTDVDSKDIDELNQYYQGKYMDDYLSDETDPNSDPYEIEYNKQNGGDTLTKLNLGSVPFPREIHEFSDSDQEEENKTDMTSFDFDIEKMATENDSNTINTLLAKHKRASSRNVIIPRSGNAFNTLSNNYKHGSRRQRSLNIVHRSKLNIRSQALANKRTISDPFHEISGTRSNKNTELMYKNEQNKRMRPKKPESLTVGIYPGPSSELTRPANTFRTVVEAPSDQYVFRGGIKLSILPTESGVFEKDSVYSENLPCHLVFESLLGRRSEHSPDMIKISISNKQFYLSKLNHNGTLATLRTIFNHILDHGITDTELVQFCESLTIFLLYYNQPGLYDVINEFHIKFRSRVNNLKEKAKSIHFYQIAVCQLMFLEITKCSNVAQSFKIEVEQKIIDNIVSFFKLLSVCERNTTKFGGGYLSKAYALVAAIVTLIGDSEPLWCRLRKEKFCPSISFNIVKLFPTSQEKWDLLQLEDSYSSMLEALKFVSFCLHHLNWSVTSDLIVLFHNLFKKRRFEDFAAEELMTTQNYVITSYRQSFPAETIFNSYLTILRSASLTASLVERIVPMSEVSQSDPPSVLVNRMNLLVLLAENSSINLERRVDELIRPILAADNLALRDESSSKTICSCILNGVLCLFEINCLKNHSFRSKIISSTFRSLVFDNKHLTSSWTTFLERMEIIFGTHNHSYANVLRGMYPCFLLMNQKNCFSKGITILLRLYMNNLPQLGTSWTQNNLFQVVKNYAQTSTSWIDHYCEIGKFLIKRQVMSWWSFFMYNDIHGPFSTKLYFDYKVIQLCDAQSFDLVKKPLFSLATDEIFINETPLFVSFLNKLINRENPTIADFNDQKTGVTNFSLVKRLFSTLHNLSYNELLLKLIANLKKCYQEKHLTLTFVRPLVEFVNINFVDLLKNSHDFLFLKRELGISDKETDKSSFRDAFRSQIGFISQACYIESGLLHAFTIREELSDYMEKLYSLFAFPSLSSPFFFFGSIIEAHLVDAVDPEHSRLKTCVNLHFLKLLNDALIERYLQVTANEFLELCKLHKALCENLLLFELQEFLEGQNFLYEIVRYQLYTLKIADGFWEFDLLMEQSKKFLSGQEKRNTVKTILSDKINAVVQEHACLNFVCLYERTAKEQSELLSTFENFIMKRDA